jgi:hypothetical protein
MTVVWYLGEMVDMMRDTTRPSGVRGTIPSAIAFTQLQEAETALFVAAVFTKDQPFLTRAKMVNQISKGRLFRWTGPDGELKCDFRTQWLRQYLRNPLLLIRAGFL